MRNGSHAGVFEQASGGVLFINGVEDLPSKAQGLLVAALETQTITRVGGATPVQLECACHCFGNAALSGG